MPPDHGPFGPDLELGLINNNNNNSPVVAQPDPTRSMRVADSSGSNENSTGAGRDSTNGENGRLPFGECSWNFTAPTPTCSCPCPCPTTTCLVHSGQMPSCRTILWVAALGYGMYTAGKVLMAYLGAK